MALVIPSMTIEHNTYSVYDMYYEQATWERD